MDPIRKYWAPNDGEIKKRKKDDSPHEKDEGYDLDLDLKAEHVWDKETVCKVYREVGEEYNKDDCLHIYDDIRSSHKEGNEMKGVEEEGG